LITTSGYGPDSFKFANGKPLNLIDGHGLLALCHQHNIPARILGTSKRRNALTMTCEVLYRRHIISFETAQ
jgi:hypothetical protein